MFRQDGVLFGPGGVLCLKAPVLLKFGPVWGLSLWLEHALKSQSTVRSGGLHLQPALKIQGGLLFGRWSDMRCQLDIDSAITHSQKTVGPRTQPNLNQSLGHEPRSTSPVPRDPFRDTRAATPFHDTRAASPFEETLPQHVSKRPFHKTRSTRPGPRHPCRDTFPRTPFARPFHETRPPKRSTSPFHETVGC